MVALDFPNAEKTFDFLEKFGRSSRKPFVKIGMELFYSEGPEIVRKIKEQGHKIFLDLKLHDIPNTVKGGMKSLRSLGADMLNLHAAGGIDMMKAAVEGLSGGETRPILIAVTQLTSISQEKMNNELLISGSVGEVVLHYAKNAKSAGLDGVVCSPLEAQKIHSEAGREFLTVTPGIRFSGDDTGDQARFTDPLKARELGADYIVVGRPVTKAEDPVEAYERCVREFCGGVK
ncbi:MAG: orotidine-5'-phosphate decarboxylase [Synergistaceae bacterium]|nr:orotidine-5'-phosphate decarboxylase [Synergistaceae bacterium]